MRKICLIMAAMLFFLPAIPVSAAPVSLPPESISARAAVLMDASTGQVLFEKNADTAMPVASITKIMTLLLIFEAVDAGRISLDDTVTVSQHAAGMGGSQVLLDAGGNYLASELVKSIIVASANDASVAMAEYVYGTEDAFVSKMNERAKQLGMNNTLFTNCNGLPNDNEGMSARDVATMSLELLKHKAYFQYSRIWLDEIVHEGGRTTMLTNTNKLIRSYDGCDGVKTGFTNAAGFCLSSSAQRGDTRMVAVILGGKDSASRFSEAEQLLNYGFSNYETVCFYKAGDIVQENQTVEGMEEKPFHVLARDDLSILMEKGSEKPEIEVERSDDLKPPLLAGDVVGKAYLVCEGKKLAETDLVIDRNMDLPGFSDYWKALIRRWMAAA